jgi:SAM-dependent methyltransferase
MHALAHADRSFGQPDLPLEPDLFGRVLEDCHHGLSTEYYLRRDDGLLVRCHSTYYFSSWEALPTHHRCLLSHARGPVLDIGAGAGQHALALQARGLAVTAIDVSPKAVAVCTARGVQDARVMNAHAIDFAPDSFHTVIMLGNSLGIAGTPEGLREMLRSLYGVVQADGRILLEMVDYTATSDPTHLRYHQRNRQLGRYPGSIRVRVEYAGYRGPDYDWLLMTLDDLRAAAVDAGWRLERCVQVNARGKYAIGVVKA